MVGFNYYLLIISFTLNQSICFILNFKSYCYVVLFTENQLMFKNSNLMYLYNQYTLLNNLTLNIWLCAKLISDYTSSLTTVATATKNICGNAGSNISLYLICKRLSVTKRHNL